MCMIPLEKEIETCSDDSDDFKSPEPKVNQSPVQKRLETNRYLHFKNDFPLAIAERKGLIFLHIF